MSNSTLEQALDYLAVLTKTFWKPISGNTIFVTEDNITKRRDYEDNVVRVFFVQNSTSVQEFQEIATAVRSLTEIRRVYTYNAQRAILMRGTPDQIALAEKLVHDLDKAESGSRGRRHRHGSEPLEDTRLGGGNHVWRQDRFESAVLASRLGIPSW